MPVNQPQTIQVVFAILTLFAATASGQHWSDDLPVYQPEKEIFGSDKVSEDVTEFFKSGIEDELIQPPSDSDKPASKTVQASFRRPQIAQAAQSPAVPSLVDRDGYLRNIGSGAIWADALRSAPSVPTQSAVPVIPPTPELSSAADPTSPSAKSVVTEGLGEFSQSAAQGQSSLGQAAAGQQAVLQAPILGANGANYPRVLPNGPSKFRLRLGFDILAWERGRPDDTVFASNEEGSEWSFGDFDFSETTPRFFIQYMGDDLTGFEFTFFDFDTFESVVAATGESNVTAFFFNAVPANTSNNRDLVYNSRLKNIELNYWHRQNQIQRSGWGVRYINLDENFDVTRGTAAADGLFSRVDNNIWGVNRMWERRRPLLNRLEFIGGLDLGLYLNNAQIDVDTLNIDDSSEGRNLAGSLGFNFSLDYLVADHVTLRFGYEGLALFGVALASTQSLEQSLFDGLDDPVLGSIYFGGFHFGAIASF